MGAKQKLNGSYFLGALTIAGLLFALTQSWQVFVIAAVSLVIASYHSGDIRR